jgi:glycosyltransferase involved in cell wall biosynthesis
MKPKVSVIIPNYNYSQYICEAVESVLLQTYPNVEIIIVDDGSKDNSLEVLEKFGDKIKILAQQNAGVSVARNNGVANSNGEFIAFLDADDIWLPEKIERQISLFLNDKTLGLVHVAVQDIDASGKNLGTHFDGLSGEVSHELLLFKRAVILGGGSGIMIPRKIFDEVGGFDLRLSTSADWDIFYQISSRYKVGFINEILLKYRLHGLNMHGNIPRMEREMLIGFEKAFTNEKNQSLKNQAYGNLHQVLAGSHFRSGNYSAFLQNAIKSLWLKPSNISYFSKFPLRLLQRNSKYETNSK